MFRKPTPDQIRAIDLGERFARTFGWAFALSFLCYPVFLVANATAENGSGGGLVLIAWLVGLLFIPKALVIGMVVSALIFFPCFKTLTRVLSGRFAAPIASFIAFYLAVVVSFHLKFSIFPIGISWDADKITYDFSRNLGLFTAVIAAVIARIMWIGADANA